jgi:hypothetical protein
MRPRTAIRAFTAAALIVPAVSARACEPVATACLPTVVVFPAYTPEGDRIGTVAARVRPPYPLERSRFTGQPVTVAYNNPGSLPGSVDPEFTLMPLPRVPQFHTRAVYPRGY